MKRIPLWRRTMMTACAAMLAVGAVAAPPDAAAKSGHWWDDAVFYQILVRSFQDSMTGPLANDGHGDLQGLIDRLDYLNDGNPATTDDLGVTALWLLPMSEASSDAGYSVDDYEAVEKDYGTNEQFRHFIDEAHRRGIRVIVDLVLNHTSNKHAWYVAGMNPESHYHQFYNWRDTQPMDANGRPLRHWSQQANGKWIYAAFSPGIPDLDVANPIVKEKLFNVARFWLEDMKVDGFRLDAIKFLVEEGSVTESSAGTHAWMRDFQSFCKSIKPDCYIVGEVWSSTPEIATYTQDQIDMCFQFELAGSMIDVARSGRAGSLSQKVGRVVGSFAPRQFAPFLANHDMTRAMEQIGRDPGRMRVAAALLLTSPGVPFMYYGEEVGIAGRNHEGRSPMQWDGTTNAGFSGGKPYWAIDDTAPKFNVAAEEKDPDSILSTYKRLIALRHAEPALRHGDYQALTVTPVSLMDYTYPKVAEGESGFGYEAAKDGSITFVFDPSQYRTTTKDGTTQAAPFDAAGIKDVSVAGDFNGWAAGAWPLEKQSDGKYVARKTASEFTSETHEFKFVVNRTRWMEPPASATNRKHTGMNGESHNIILKRGGDGVFEGVTVTKDVITFRFDPATMRQFVDHSGSPASIDAAKIKEVVALGAFGVPGKPVSPVALEVQPDGSWQHTLKRDSLTPSSSHFRFQVNKEYWVVPSSNARNVTPAEDGSPLYAFLRTIPGEEALLCIINPSDKAQTEYDVTGGSIAELVKETTATDALTGADLQPPTISSDGRMNHYRPVASIPPQSYALIRLRSGKD